MNRLGLSVWVAMIFAAGAQPTLAQFYGGGFYGPGAYGPFAGYPAPYAMGAYLPPYGSMVPGFSGINGFGPYGGGPGLANAMANYPGFGWWPLSATDVRVTAIPNPAAQPDPALTNGASKSFLQQHSANPSTSAPTGEAIKLVCPKRAGGSLTYWLNGTMYSIQPGYSQEFRDDRTWKLEFRKGGEGTELVTYTLKPGHFNFAVGANGWELRQVVGTIDLPPAPQPAPLVSPAPGPTPVSTGPAT